MVLVQAGRFGIELAAVLFRGAPPGCEYLVQSTGFTRDVREFRTWLANLQCGPTADAGYATAVAPLADALCAAHKVSLDCVLLTCGSSALQQRGTGKISSWF